jgi:protein phosphatase
VRSLFNGVGKLTSPLIGEAGDRLTQLSGEAFIMTLHRLRNSVLIEAGGGDVDWARAFSGDAIEGDLLQSMMEYVTERPAEAMGSAAAFHLGRTTVQGVELTTAALAEADFSSLDQVIAYEESLQDMAALVRAESTRTERIDLETPEALSLIEAELLRVAELRSQIESQRLTEDSQAPEEVPGSRVARAVSFGLGVLNDLREWIGPIALAASAFIDGGIGLAMAGLRRPGGSDSPFYGYEAAPSFSESPMIMIPRGSSGRIVSRPLDPSRSWTLGRGTEVDLLIPGQFQSVSNEHATIEPVTDARTGEVRWQLIDHSTNGTVVDGVDVSGRRVTLTPGPHEIILGRAAVVHLSLPGVPQPSPPPASTAWRETFEGLVPGLSAETHEGRHYKEQNEDRFVVVPLPGGRRLSFVIDGMGGHAGGERAATIAANVIETALRDGRSLEDALRLSNVEIIRDNAAQGVQSRAPGAVAVGVELNPVGPGAFEASFASVGDAEAVVLRLSESGDPLVHRTTRWPLGEPVLRGNTLNLHIAPGAHIVFSSLGGSSGSDIRIDRSTATLRPGDLILSGTDGFFENFTTDEIVSIIRNSGATDADGIRTVLMTEAQLRMEILGRITGDTVLTPVLYREAYRAVTGREAPPDWRGMHEGYVLTPRGDVRDPSGARTVAHFKCDNVTLVAQIVGGGEIAVATQTAAPAVPGSTPGLLRRIGGVVRNALTGPLWLFMGSGGPGGGAVAPPSGSSPIVSDNLARLQSEEFKRVLNSESFGGNAGPNRAGVNVAVDADGRIVAIGNPQSLPTETRRALDEGRYLRVTLSVDLRGRIDWERCATSDPIPVAAKETLRRTVEEFNASLAQEKAGS